MQQRSIVRCLSFLLSISLLCGNFNPCSETCNSIRDLWPCRQWKRPLGFGKFPPPETKEGRKEVLHDRLTETFIQPLRVLWTSTASYRMIQMWIICKELYLLTYSLCCSLLFYTCALWWYESWRYF